MRLTVFMRDKLMYIGLNFIVILIIITFMTVLGLNSYTIFFINFIYFLGFFIPLTLEYMKKRDFYNNIQEILANLDKKYLSSELIEEPEFEEGKIFYDYIVQCSKSMNDEIAKYSISYKEYKEYIEMWIHEVKTPIASSKLIIENNPSKITESLEEEINEIDYYLEQVLFYARSYSVEKDYIIKRTNLRDLINSVIRKNSKTLIKFKIKLSLEDLDYYIYTDTKWIEFIINQIISNSIKYRSENPSIEIYAMENKNNTCLYIKDNGIGINKKDINRVFEKGYTGSIGRTYAKSTGIGLYLCKKLCDKLGLHISITSKDNLGTTLQIIFPHTSMTNVIKNKK
ncbi:ATP-binding protein [Terrisporobacter petrolearius]|uniref:ATP-binding protein n=1 Tax=Terrisporobacter petrolearius TaxID=1460447 RepID=UPI003B001096